MNKFFIKLFLIIGMFSFVNISFANDYSCSRSSDNSNSIYLGNNNIKLTSDSDVLSCSKWLDKMNINTLDGNDIINTLKSDNKGTYFNLGNGNDIFNQDVNKGVLSNLTIDGGNGEDKIIINTHINNVVIDGNCSFSCNIYIKDKWGNAWWRFKDVVLKSIEKVQTLNGNLNFNNTGENTNISNTDTSTDITSYDKIDLSVYKYLIPAYFWSQDFNDNLLKLPNKSSIIIVNPSNGDFENSENIFQNMIEKIHKKNNLAIGYIYSKYGNRDLSIIKKRIDNRLKYYPNINGIFVDETSSANNKLDFYKTIFNYIKSKNKNLIVVLNPGTTPDKGYFEISDNIVAYENPCNTYSKYPKLSWLNDYSNYKISYLAYSCSYNQKQDLYKKYGKYITYFTFDGKDGNPWDNLDLSMLDNNKSNVDIVNYDNSSIKSEGLLVGQFSKDKWATYKSNDKILEIDPWNIKSTDGDAKMYYNKSNGKVVYTQNFKNIKIQDVSGYVLGYPEIYVGNKPWNGNYLDAGSKLPIKLNELKSLNVDATWKYNHSQDLSLNFAMEGWFTKNKFEKSKVSKGEVEMMIMWYRNIQGAAGIKVGTTTISVYVNGIKKNIIFDIYKTTIDWDFITFIPRNYKDFKNINIDFNILDFTNIAKKYVPQINDLYLENWEFGTEYGTPKTKNAKLSWEISKFNVKGIKKENYNNNGNINLEQSPFNILKFQEALKQSKLTYPDSHTKVVNKGQFENYNSDFFYLSKNGDLVFELKKLKGNDVKIRNELRQQQNKEDNGWLINNNSIHILDANIKLQKLSNIDEYTFLQIHSEKNPLLRIVVKKEKNNKNNHIWAVLRINTNNSGKRTNRYDLGSVSDIFDDFRVEVGNNNLKIYKNGKILINNNISYWNENKNYFKVGIYDSKNGKGPFKIQLLFNKLKFLENINSNIKNNNTKNNKIITSNTNNLEIKNIIYDTNKNLFKSDYKKYNYLITLSDLEQIKLKIKIKKILKKYNFIKERLYILKLKISNLLDNGDLLKNMDQEKINLLGVIRKGLIELMR